MATRPMTLDAPPAQPPAVQAGGAGAPPMAGVGGMLASRAGAPPGAEGGKGQIVTMWEVIKQAIQRWGSLDPALGAFSARMIAVGDSGVENVAARGGGPMGARPGAGPGAAPPPPTETARPTGMGAGEGFPG
jgi:hypothetical protein